MNKRALFETDSSAYNKVRLARTSDGSSSSSSSAAARRSAGAETAELTDFYSVTTVGESLVKTLNALQKDGRMDDDTARLLMQTFNQVMVPTIKEVTKIAEADPEMRRGRESVSVEGKIEYFQNHKDAWKLELSDCSINTGYSMVHAKRARVLLNLTARGAKDKTASTT